MALSVITLLTAITTGGAWYTGNQIEQHYPQLLEQVNHHLKRLSVYDINAQINDVKLTKGIFSSTVQYDLHVQTNDNVFTFKGHDIVYHGPLPLNRVMKANLMPMLLSSEMHISSLDSKIKTYFADSDILSATTNINYAGDVTGNVTLNPFKSDHIETSKIHFDGNYSGLGKQILSADLIKIKKGNANNEAIAFSGLNYEAHYVQDNLYPELKGLGDYQVSIKKFSFINEKNHIIHLNDIVSKGNSQIKHDRMLGAGNLTLKVDSARDTKVANLGQIHLNMLMDMDAKALYELVQLSDKVERESPEIQNQFQIAVMNLLTQAPTLKINELSIENAKGKTTLDLNLNLEKFDLAQISKTKSIEDILKIFKPSQLNLNVNLAASEELAKQLLILSPDETYIGTPEENAQLRIQELANNAKHSGIAMVDTENIKLALNIENGNVNLNGRTVSKSELQLALWAMMLSTNGMK